MINVIQMRNHTEATAQPFISEDFENHDLMFEHLFETMILPEEEEEK